jgi:hypothetical protein
MKEELKNIFAELKILMSNAEPYMSEVEDWLYTNYSLKKVFPGEEKPNNSIDFIAQAKAKMANKSGSISVNRSSDDEENNSDEDSAPKTIFAQRAGIKAHKKALDFIKGRTSGAADPSEFVGEDEEYADVSDEENYNEPPLNAREANQLSSLFEDPSKGKSSNELDIENLKRVRKQIAGRGIFRRE